MLYPLADLSYDQTLPIVDPSTLADDAPNTPAIIKGLLIHKLLEWKIKHYPYSYHELSGLIEFDEHAVDMDELRSQAEKSYQALMRKFDAADKTIMSEVPIIYHENNRTMTGIIDAIIYQKNRMAIIDFKTKALDNDSDHQLLADRYLPQLNKYKQGMQQMYPDTSIDLWILFTDNQELVAL